MHSHLEEGVQNLPGACKEGALVAGTPEPEQHEVACERVPRSLCLSQPMLCSEHNTYVLVPQRAQNYNITPVLKRR